MSCASVSLRSVVKHFAVLSDPRHHRNRRHLLVDVITIAVCGVIVGCDGPTAMVIWAKAKQDWLKELLELPNGIPSRDFVTENSDGTTCGDVRYFISSCYLSGKRFAEAVRNHWGIENSLHWVLDVTFGEDQSRTRNRHMADNLSWLRRFAVSLLKRHPAKESIRGKTRMAGWNNEFLMEVLMAQGV